MRATIDDLRSQTMPPDEIVLVDNSAEAPGSVPPDGLPGVEIVVAEANGGYAAGMNLGLARASGDLLLTVTHDVLLSSNAVEELVGHLVLSSAGAVGPVVGDRGHPDSVYSAGGTRRGWDLRHVGQDSLLADWIGRPPEIREWLDGCCVLMRRELWEDTGPMDEKYFMYFEEIDLHVRAVERGWTFEVVPSAVVWQSSGQRDAPIAYRNRLRLIANNGTRREFLREVTTQLRRLVALVRRRRLREANVIWRGLAGWILHRDPRKLL